MADDIGKYRKVHDNLQQCSDELGVELILPDIDEIGHIINTQITTRNK